MAAPNQQQAFRQIEGFLHQAQLRRRRARRRRQMPTRGAGRPRPRPGCWPPAPAWRSAVQPTLWTPPSGQRSLAPDNVLTRLLAAEAMLNGGKRETGLALLDSIACGQSVAIDQKLGQLYTLANRHDAAARADTGQHLPVSRTVSRALPILRFPRSRWANMEDAGLLFDRVLALDPGNSDAWYNRATLRRQTPENNHVAGIERAIARGIRHPMDDVLLHYALAKELEDIGEHTRAFVALRRGADARRRMLSYRV